MKSLVNPLLWYLLLQLAGLLMLMRRNNTRVVRVLFVLTVMLTAAATPWARFALESTLKMPATTSDAIPPAYIFVLGGGYFAGAMPDDDMLTIDSQRRVMQGAALWHRYPKAMLVLSGMESSYAGIRDADRLGQLMASSARARGVPPTSILLEPRSQNTREHPVEALRLTGVTTDKSIAVVTSGWHMQRAQREFCRHFAQVSVEPMPSMRRPSGWQSFLPDAGTLNANTDLTREWVGMMWYGLRNMAGPASKC